MTPSRVVVIVRCRRRLRVYGIVCTCYTTRDRRLQTLTDRELRESSPSWSAVWCRRPPCDLTADMIVPFPPWTWPWWAPTSTTWSTTTWSYLPACHPRIPGMSSVCYIGHI